ncbi:MAG: hypothetical protein ABJQ70_12655 [Roseobacter sp.]|uniref:hypothetical protein n=1 Tax=Hyphomonas sp. TaxID=87 RepID=UPI003299C552
MTISPNTTPVSATTAFNPLLAADRIVFRKSLDHLQDALKADWQVFLRRNKLDTPEALEFGHQAAEAWSDFLEDLRQVRDMDAAHPDLRAAAVELIQTTPGFYPHTSELSACQHALRPLAERHKHDDIGLHDLLHEAYLLTWAHRGNIDFLQPPVRL